MVGLTNKEKDASYWAHQPLSSVATQPSQRLGMARAKAHGYGFDFVDETASSMKPCRINSQVAAALLSMALILRFEQPQASSFKLQWCSGSSTP